MNRKKKILFLCTGNSCRSQMAEGWAKALVGETFEAFSAGVETHGLNPNAVRVMAEAGVDISGHRSKHVKELLDIGIDCVVTVCDHAAEACPLFPGKAKIIHHSFQDPPALAKSAKTEEEALGHYRRVRDEIRAFVATLPALCSGDAAADRVLPRTGPEALGIPSAAIERFVERAEQSIESLHSFMLLRHGSVAAEGWWAPYRSDAPHTLFSLSKSFTSTAVGLAADAGLLSVDDSVLSFFPSAAPKKVSPNLAAMKVRHLLSMSTGHDQDTIGLIFGKKDHNPERAFLALKVDHEPGTHFTYNSGASYMLSSIVQKLTGQTVLDYLTPRLLDPLGIQGAQWESYVNGVNFGGWGLSLKTEDIARFGQLFLQKGLWEGRRLVPASWIEEATSRHIANGDNPDSDWNQGYGYQFWRCRHGCYRGDGAFGQFCLVMPEQDAVLAITAGTSDMQAVLDLVWDTLLPAMGAGAAPNAQPAATALRSRLDSLSLKPPRGPSSSPLASQVSGRTYRFEKNLLGLKSLRFDFGAASCTVVQGYARRGGAGRKEIPCGYGSWLEGTMMAASPPQRSRFERKVAASGVWTGSDTFTLILCAFETPFTYTFECRFQGEELRLAVKPNVAFGPNEALRLIGSSAQR